MLEILLASPRSARYSGTVSGTDGRAAFEVQQEITDAIIEADMRLCMAVLDTDDHPYRPGFMVASSNLANEAMLPSFVGAVGDVQIDETGANSFKGGFRAASREDVLEVIQCPSLYADAKRWYYIDKNKIYHTGSAARVFYPSFTKNDAACQAHELYTGGVICATIDVLFKDTVGNDFVLKYSRAADLAEQKIRARQLWLPEDEELAAEAA